jgi:hypothetical protein
MKVETASKMTQKNNKMKMKPVELMALYIVPKKPSRHNILMNVTA